MNFHDYSILHDLMKDSAFNVRLHTALERGADLAARGHFIEAFFAHEQALSAATWRPQTYAALSMMHARALQVVDAPSPHNNFTSFDMQHLIDFDVEKLLRRALKKVKVEEQWLIYYALVSNEVI